MKCNFRKINTAIILCIVFCVLAYVALGIVFPSFSYYMNKTDKFKVSVLKKNFGGKNYLSITPLYDYPYKNVKVKFDLASGNEISDAGFPVLYGYEAEFYPVSSKEIATNEELREYLFFENDTNIPNGTLLSNEEAVFFVSRGQAKPFLGPEIFVRLGFDWNDVIGGQEDVIASLAQSEKLDFTSAHPDGTILEFPDGQLYLVWEKERIKVPEDILFQVWGDFYLIKVSAREKEPVGSCVAAKNKSKKIQCELFGVKEYSATGHTYLFEVPEVLVSRVTEAKICFDMLGNFDLSVAKESLKRIKDELSLRYSEDLKK